MPFNNKQTLKFKTSLMIAFLAVINHNYYDNNQWTLKKKNQTNKQSGSTSTNSNPQTWLSSVFCEVRQNDWWQWNTKLLSRVHMLLKGAVRLRIIVLAGMNNLHSYVNLDTWNSLSIVPILVSPAIFVIISSWKGNKTRKEDVSTRVSPGRCVHSRWNW